MNKGTLLIVDDEPIIIQIITNILEGKIEKILSASNGQEALDIICKNQDIACVICDIRMPVMDGIETIKNVREKNIEVPFIFYSGHGDDKLMMEAAKYGAYDFLDKPNLSNLEECVFRGLTEGFERKSKKNEDKNLMNEYKTLMNKINDQK